MIDALLRFLGYQINIMVATCAAVDLDVARAQNGVVQRCGVAPAEFRAGEA